MALVDDVVRDVAQLFPKANSATIRSAFVRSARRFCSETRWLRTSITANLVAGTKTYSLGGDPLLEVVDTPLVQLTLTTGTILSIPKADPTTFNPNDAQGRPRFHAYLPEAQVTFHPAPDAAYPVTIWLAVQPKDGVSEIPDELLTKWRYAIEDGACAFLYQMPEPWVNHQLAEMKRLSFVSAISNAKADVARVYQSGSIYGARRSFIVG